MRQMRIKMKADEMVCKRLLRLLWIQGQTECWMRKTHTTASVFGDSVGDLTFLET